jgi:hypothetical protein
METMNVIYASQDSMLIDFVYSMDKYAAYMQSKETYFPNVITGQYVFVRDSSLTIFSILLGKKVKRNKYLSLNFLNVYLILSGKTSVVLIRLLYLIITVFELKLKPLKQPVTLFPIILL